MNRQQGAESIDVRHSAGQVLAVNAAVVIAASLSIGRPSTTPISMGGPREH
ncbi:hypothetical protein EV132_112191 [Rhizobium sullae]|uniref:Uncharacterized protein n=1 Tax=Rhizobium sullae TaxID=50338 RepID=A0A4R3Q2X0_RHISU|nr:hypothetical protein EV132_112191 [Rhizobium sullae]